jgi:hypothetical protein
MFSFVYGDTTADDDEAVIAPTYDATVGRWHAVSSLAEGEDPVAAIEAEPTLALTGEVSIEGDLVVDMGGGGDTSGSVMVGSQANAGLPTVSLESAWSVNVGTAQEIPFSPGTRVHFAIAAVIYRIGTPALGDDFGIAINLKPTGGLPAATFCSMSLAGPDSDNSEVVIHGTLHIAAATGGIASNRDIIVTAQCIQVLGGGAPVSVGTLRRFDTSTHASVTLGSGLVAANVANTNNVLQVSVEAATNTQTLANHYEVSVKSIIVDFSKGEIS